MRRRGGEPGPAAIPRHVRPVLQPHRPPPEFLLEMATGRLEPLDPAVEGPDGRPRRWWEIGNGWSAWPCTRCPHTLPATDGERGVEAHLLTCRHLPTQDEIRMTRSVFRTEALPPQQHPIPTRTPRHPRGGAPSPRAGTSNPTQARPPHPSPARRDGWSCPWTRHRWPRASGGTSPTARPGPLVVRAVWHVMAGSADRTHLP